MTNDVKVILDFTAKRRRILLKCFLLPKKSMNYQSEDRRYFRGLRNLHMKYY